jgi:hypothetical protein
MWAGKSEKGRESAKDRARPTRREGELAKANVSAMDSWRLASRVSTVENGNESVRVRPRETNLDGTLLKLKVSAKVRSIRMMADAASETENAKVSVTDL